MRTLLLLAVLSIPAVPAAAAPMLGEPIRVLGPGATVEIEVLTSSSSFDNEIRLYTPDLSSYRVLGIDNQNIGTTISLGEFAGGTELVFAIANTQTTVVHYVNSQAVFFTGPGSRNPSGYEHALVDATLTSSGFDAVALVEFEDLLNLGDHDFDDARFLVRQRVLLPTPEPASLVLWSLLALAGAVFVQRRRTKVAA